MSVSRTVDGCCAARSRRPGSNGVRNPRADAAVPGRRAWPCLCLGLRLQLRVVFLDECPKLVGHGEQLRPLLLVERDRKAAEAVHRHAALLADLETDAATMLTLEALVLSLETFQFRFQVLVCHLGFLDSSAARGVMPDRRGDCIPRARRAAIQGERAFRRCRTSIRGMMNADSGHGEHGFRRW